jgi:hypothetical protein
LKVEPRTLIWASVGALLVALFMLGETWQDYKRYEHLPVETLTVVAMHGIEAQGPCRADWYEVTYRSNNAPAELPTEFTLPDCTDPDDIGEQLTVVRVVHADGSVELVERPAQPRTHLVTMPIVWGTWAFLMVVILIGRWQARQKEPERALPAWYWRFAPLEVLVAAVMVGWLVTQADSEWTRLRWIALFVFAAVVSMWRWWLWRSEQRSRKST